MFPGRIGEYESPRLMDREYPEAVLEAVTEASHLRLLLRREVPVVVEEETRHLRRRFGHLVRRWC